MTQQQETYTIGDVLVMGKARLEKICTQEYGISFDAFLALCEMIDFRDIMFCKYQPRTDIKPLKTIVEKINETGEFDFIATERAFRQVANQMTLEDTAILAEMEEYMHPIGLQDEFTQMVEGKLSLVGSYPSTIMGSGISEDEILETKPLEFVVA